MNKKTVHVFLPGALPIKTLVLLFLLFQFAFANWPQLQNTPGNEGYAPATFLKPSKIDTLVKYNMGSPILAAPVIMGDTVYAACDSGKVVAINYRNGGLAWSFTAPAGIVSTPAADNNKIYVATLGGVIYALDRVTGEQRWAFSVDDTLPLYKEIRAPIKINRNRLYVGCFNHRLYCLDTAGVKQWSYRTSYYIKQAAAIKDSFIVFTSADELLYGLVDNGSSYTLRWTMDFATTTDGGFMCRNSPTLVDTFVFVNYTENDGYYGSMAVSRNTGVKYQYGSDGVLNNTGFCVDGDGVVYENGTLYTTNPYATQAWHMPHSFYSRYGRAAPIVTGNYLVSHNAFNPTGIYLYNISTSTFTDSIPMRGYDISSFFAVSDSALFFGTQEGVLFGVGSGKGTPTAVAAGRKNAAEEKPVFKNTRDFSATIGFTLAMPLPISLQVYDAHGKLVYANSRLCPAGFSRMAWTGIDQAGRSVPAGVYVTTLLIGQKKISSKTMRLK